MKGETRAGLLDLENASREKQTEEHDVIDEALVDKGDVRFISICRHVMVLILFHKSGLHRLLYPGRIIISSCGE